MNPTLLSKKKSNPNKSPFFIKTKHTKTHQISLGSIKLQTIPINCEKLRQSIGKYKQYLSSLIYEFPLLAAMKSDENSDNEL
jgi:hypothetical protein